MNSRLKTHYCTLSKDGKEMYYIGKKRVSKTKFYLKFPTFDKNQCLTITKREILRKNLNILEKISQKGGKGSGSGFFKR